MSNFLPKSIRSLIEEFAKLPGVGPKSAQRLAMHLLHSPESRVRPLGEAVLGLRENVIFCEKCWNLGERRADNNSEVDGDSSGHTDRSGDIDSSCNTGTSGHTDSKNLCKICDNPGRDKSVICVVEEILDVVALEKSGEYNGLYHVLHGVLSPVDGIGPEQLKLEDLFVRVANNKDIKEIILATNPSLEGEATALYIQKQLTKNGVKLTRIARGLPVGGDLEYADEVTLGRALNGRGEF